MHAAHGHRAQCPPGVLGGFLEEVQRRHSGQSARHQPHWEPQAVSEQDGGPFGEMAEAKDAQGTGENSQGQSKATASGTEKKVTEKVRWEGSRGLHPLEEQALGTRRLGALSSQRPLATAHGAPKRRGRQQARTGWLALRTGEVSATRSAEGVQLLRRGAGPGRCPRTRAPRCSGPPGSIGTSPDSRFRNGGREKLVREKTARDRACCRPGATESLGPSEGRKPGDGGLRAAAWPGQTSGGG